ncbi:hypothetical protein BH11PLA2_BH11PLA2_50590 [soil metagenome]
MTINSQQQELARWMNADVSRACPTVANRFKQVSVIAIDGEGTDDALLGVADAVSLAA